MTIKTIRKVVTVGNSLGITLPSDKLEQAGLLLGDYIEIEFRKVN